ncbi:fumarylacetoacetate hydrolase family protein [Pinisolibacter aquiterrae]|uniref:fumarylacetoacetate hydrolase family protein n=1 Tax=Pinisolibacter aquiterrae TaxID=2815579 RepID=UPI001C3DCE47|nr:fumarylacetoacetate hydrolase family protein [Pinisolibacter aquiterrae]MBV5265018.1 fumarylacetoacetate hydrolase family protein [Pinisolibacter aquiterrae]MCC8235600.1 fumarylacetoacetate hydrolase family protein [Pinisolibacter aquiterrae]
MPDTPSTALLFTVPPAPSVAVVGEARRYPVNRIFCVGRNYADHAKEMGVEVDREAPFYFLKQAGAIVDSGATIAYPPGTENYHYEMEFVVAIGAPARAVPVETALDAVLGYACGLDMTRRDLQLQARAKQRPWDLGKNFEQSAIITDIVPKAAFGVVGPQRIILAVDGVTKQDAHLSDLVWSVEELVSHLSRYYHLAPGDLIYTGTPAGVGPVVAGDVVTGSIDGLPPISLTIAPAEAV